MAGNPVVSDGSPPKAATGKSKGAPERSMALSHDERTYSKSSTVIRRITQDGRFLVKTRRSSGGGSPGVRKEPLQECKVPATRRFSNKAAPRIKTRRGSLAATSLKEGALGPSGASPVPSSFGAPERKRIKSGAKQAAEAPPTSPPSTRLIKENSIHAEEFKAPPLLEELTGEERGKNPSPHPADTFLEVLQEQNKDLARESMTLRRALLQHISQEQLLSLLSGVSADTSASGPVGNTRPEAVKVPRLSQDGARVEKPRVHREKHIYQPCVKKFFEVLSCCAGNSLEASPYSFEDSDAPGPLTFITGRQSEDADTLQPSRVSQRTTLDKVEQEKQEEQDPEAPISIEFFPLGRATKDAATQTDLRSPKSLRTQVLESPSPSAASSDHKLSLSKRELGEKQSSPSAPRVSSETFRFREGLQSPLPNYEIESASQSPFNLPCTFPLASLLPQSPYANPCLLPLVAFNGDPLWVVSRIRKAVRGTLRASPRPQEALAGLYDVWSGYLHELSALKKRVDSALILHKNKTKNDMQDAGVQADPTSTEAASRLAELASLPLENDPQASSIQRGTTGAVETSPHEEPQSTGALHDGKVLTPHTSPDATKKEGENTEPVRASSREPSTTPGPTGAAKRLRRPSSLASGKPSFAISGRNRIP